MGFHENFMSWSFTGFHNIPSLCAGGNEAPTFAFSPSASALHTAPYQRLELPPDAEASRTAARTVVILAFCDGGDEKRGGWPPDSIQHRDETSWGDGVECGGISWESGKEWRYMTVFFFNYK